MLATYNGDEIAAEDRRPTAVASIVIARLQMPMAWRWYPADSPVKTVTAVGSSKAS